jgi:hypothetical protein
VETCETQFTAFEPFRKIAFSIDSCASTMDEFTLCAQSWSVAGRRPHDSATVAVYARPPVSAHRQVC